MTKFGHGDVIRYSYLWGREYVRGEESGRKARPRCVMTIFRGQDGKKQPSCFRLPAVGQTRGQTPWKSPRSKRAVPNFTRPLGSSWMNSTATIWKHLSPLRTPNLLERLAENLWRALRPQPLLPSEGSIRAVPRRWRIPHPSPLRKHRFERSISRHPAVTIVLSVHSAPQSKSWLACFRDQPRLALAKTLCRPRPGRIVQMAPADLL